MKRKMFCVALLLWLLAGCTEAQETCTQTEMLLPTRLTVDTEPIETVQKVPVAATMTKQTCGGLNYWLYTPADPMENMPLLVYLHGSL